jgi:hypothetical protein
VTALDDGGRHPGAERTAGQRAGQTGTRRAWARVALRLYPSTWRDRFGTEFGVLLDETRATPAVLFDVLVAAVDAHLHPTGPRRRWPLMIERLRLSELVVFASWVVFVVAGLAFQRMTEGAPYTGIADAQPSVQWTWLAVVAGAVLSLCAVIFASLPIALAIARTAIAARQWRQVGLLAVPPAALAIWVGVTAVLLSVAGTPPDGAARVALFLLWVGVFLLAAVTSTVAVSAAALGAEVDGALYRRAARPALLTTGAMLVVVAAVLAWGIALAIAAPATFWGDEGILGGSTVLTWLGVVVVMAGATAVAVRAAIHARGATTRLAA